MRLHENRELFTEAVKFTARRMGLPAIYIEKDYWVTKALQLVFSSPCGEDVVFKGGTALAKCFKYIERFSEDIDLVVLRREGETGNQMKSKLKAIGSAVTVSLPEIQLDNITRKFGMSRKTAHSYSQVFSGDYGQVRDAIIIESTWLGSPNPYTRGSVQSYIYETIREQGEPELIINYGLEPFEVQVLEPGKTLCEKIMSLCRFSYETEPLMQLALKIRHTYDLCMMLQDAEIELFFESEAFESTLLQVAHEDLISFKNNKDWLSNHPKNALIFRDINGVWPSLSHAYQGKFKLLVFGKLPIEGEIILSLERIKKRLDSIEWKVEVN